MNIDTLAKFVGACPVEGFWYLATPYSKYVFGQKQAFIDASVITARLVEAGVPTYSPIAHTHPVAEHGDMDKLDHNIWLPLDEHMMRAAQGIIVAELPGWRDSYGVQYEIEFFKRRAKAVLRLDEINAFLPVLKASAEADRDGEECSDSSLTPRSPAVKEAQEDINKFLSDIAQAASDVSFAVGFDRAAEGSAPINKEALSEPPTPTFEDALSRASIGEFRAAMDKYMNLPGIAQDAPLGVASNGHAPADAKERKNHPLASGLLDYFPDALLAVANLSKFGNDQHNPGQPMHHARGKSTDHADCIMRHMVDRGTRDADNKRHSTKVAWRSLALLQEEIEQSRLAMGVPPEDVLPRGARAPEEEQSAYQRTGDASLLDGGEVYWYVGGDGEPRRWKGLNPSNYGWD